MTQMLLAAVLASVLFSQTFSTCFLTPRDLSEVRNVRLAVRPPEPGQILVGKEPERPKLWYYPAAAEVTGDGVARVWYQRVNVGEKEYSDQRTLCLGEIKGGRWSMPALTSETPVWGGPDNVCMRRSPYKPTWGGFNVFQILKTSQGYRMLYWDQPTEKGVAGGMVAVSDDGVRWTRDAEAAFTEHNDAFTLLEKDGEYLLYQTLLEDWPTKPYPDNIDKKRRLIALRRSKDLRSWTRQEVILRPDSEDPAETEFYLAKVFRYGDGFAGLVMKYYADPKLPGKHSGIIKNELIVSDDGVRWLRPFRDTDLGFWTYADPFVLDGRLNFVVWKDGKMMLVGYPDGRMIGVEADAKKGRFVSPVLKLGDSALALNADAHDGWIEAQLLDERGKPWRGVKAVRLEHVDGASLALPFVWKDTQPKAESKCRIRFRMQNARLYGIAGTQAAQ